MDDAPTEDTVTAIVTACELIATGMEGMLVSLFLEERITLLFVKSRYMDLLLEAMLVATIEFHSYQEDDQHVNLQHAVAELRPALLMAGRAATGDTDRAHTPAGTATRGGSSTLVAGRACATSTYTIDRTAAGIVFAISRSVWETTGTLTATHVAATDDIATGTVTDLELRATGVAGTLELLFQIERIT
jgi:hypothetical protein